MAEEKNANGPIAIVVGADPSKRLVLIGFNTALNRIELTPEGARDLAHHMIARADIADGTVPAPDDQPPKLRSVNDVEGAPV